MSELDLDAIEAQLEEMDEARVLGHRWSICWELIKKIPALVARVRELEKLLRRCLTEAAVNAIDLQLVPDIKEALK